MSHVLVLVSRRYNAHELWVALGILKQRGHTFEVVSSAPVIVDEVSLRPNRLKRLFTEVDPTEMNGTFDGLMVISGDTKDTALYWEDAHAKALVEAANAESKPIGAICAAVPTIRYAAEGRIVSAFPLIRCRQLIAEAGATLRTVSLTRDGNIVTAEYQAVSVEWSEEFCNLLEGKPVQYDFVDSGFTPLSKRPRKPIPAVEALKRGRRTPERLSQKDVEKTSP